MRRTLYNRFIKPVSTDSDQAEREIVLNYLLVGTFILSLVTFLGTLLEPILKNQPPLVDRLTSNFFTIVFIVILYSVARYRRHYAPVATILTLLIAAFGCFVALQWGILDPDGLLLLSLAVVMAGILIGALYSVYVTCGIALVMLYLQHGQSNGSLRPELNWLKEKPGAGDVIIFSTLLLLIALVSWLFNRQMEMSLKRARRSEKALQRQKDLLEIKVRQRTQQLEAARLEQMGELYRFAELGRLSTALFHDLANHLANISVDIEGLKGHERSDITRRVHDSVRHIDGVVQRVRQQIQGKSNVEVFNVIDEINEIMRILAFDADQANVSFTIDPGNVRATLLYKGDLTRFRQVLLNLMCNAIEAYPSRPRTKPRVVAIKLERVKARLFVSVTDFASVIPARQTAKIFEPFYTTKAKGVGIGLFIVKRVVEHDFKGKIELKSTKEEGTTFTIGLPGSYYARAPRP